MADSDPPARNASSATKKLPRPGSRVSKKRAQTTTVCKPRANTLRRVVVSDISARADRAYRSHAKSVAERRPK